jgi:hypothetical protein
LCAFLWSSISYCCPAALWPATLGAAVLVGAYLSGFAAWQGGEGSQKWLSHRDLLARIREIYEETKWTQRSARIYQELI